MDLKIQSFKSRRGHFSNTATKNNVIFKTIGPLYFYFPKLEESNIIKMVFYSEEEEVNSGYPPKYPARINFFREGARRNE